MKLDGRRENDNVDDRRRMSGTAKTGLALGIGCLGIGGIILVAIVIFIVKFLSGGNMMDDIKKDIEASRKEKTNVITSYHQQREFTQEEEELAAFSKKVLASTEDVWTKVFQEYNLGEYRAPTMILYTDAVDDAGEGITGGAFYITHASPHDYKEAMMLDNLGEGILYIDLSFFTSMKRQLGADGDFAYAYVIAHEVGHHVQHQQSKRSQMIDAQAMLMGEEDWNKLSVRIELQADFYAGVWAHYEQKMFGSLEDGDLQKAVQCALQIGDNYLQEKDQRKLSPCFTHGISGTLAQRMKWLKLGLQTGDMRQDDTFSKSDSQL